MAKITFTGKQHVLTVPKDLVEMMGWDKGTEVVISKYPGQNLLYIEELTGKKRQKENISRGERK